MRVPLGLDAQDSGMDEVIAALISSAEAYGRLYCRLREDEALPEFLLVQMVCEDFGRLDGAGVSSRTISGATEKYRGGYSDGVTAVLRALRHPAGGGTC